MSSPDPSPQTPVARTAATSRGAHGRRRASKLLSLDEVYVGRPGLGEDFAYRDAGGHIVADVEVLHLDEASRVEALVAGDPSRHVDERWVVLEHERPVFFVERYQPAEDPAFGVFDPDGVHLATFLSEGGLLHRNVLVREAASAPAATISVHHHRHVLTELDGRELGWCWRVFSAVGNDNDDEVWGLKFECEPALLDRRALVAAPLVCHLLAFPKRRADSGSEVAIALFIAVPPVGLAVAIAEHVIDGLYWIRRRFD
jgi:hypothetical protein